MFDMHIQIDAPEVAEALNRLADALNAQTEVIRGGIPEIPSAPKIEAYAPAAPVTATNVQSQPVVPSVPVTAAQPPVTPVVPTAPSAAAFPAVPAVPTAPAAVPPVAAPVAPAPVAAQAARTYTLTEITNAAVALNDAGKRPELIALLQSFGVEAITKVPPARYAELADRLRALGATI